MTEDGGWERRGTTRSLRSTSAVLALALVDTGHEREAFSIAVAALAPHLPGYQRSMAGYADALLDDDQAG